MKNSYEGVLEPWKVELIQQRAKVYGIRGHDLEDVQQDIAIELLKFRYDPVAWPGTAEAAVITSIVDHILSKARRKKRRYDKRLADYSVGHAPGEEVQAPCEQLDLAMEVCNAVEGLSPEEQIICQALAGGQSVNEIARTLKLDWHSVQQRVQKIRLHFEKLGLGPPAKAPEQNGTAQALLTANQAAALCGKSLRTWRSWDAAGWVPGPVRIGRSLLWRADELHNWIAAGCPQRDEWDVRR